jgi:non-specific serine/threonine protein kinase
MALSLAWLGIPVAIQGDVSAALGAAQSAMSLARLMQSRSIELVASAVASNILSMKQAEEAIRVGEQALTISRESGDLWARGWVLMATAQAHWLQGDRQVAEAQALEGATCKHALDDRAGLQALLETLAWMAAERGAHQRAATLLGGAQRVRQSSAIQFQEGYRQQHERCRALVLEGLGQGRYDARYGEGLAMSIDEAMAFAADETLPPPPAAIKTKTETPLTKRELEIARLIAEDMSNQEIATKLFISERTVETHITHMFNKLGLNSRVQLTRWLAGTGNTEPIRARKHV